MATAKERVVDAVAHRQPEFTPYHLSFTVPIRQKLVEYYGDENLNDIIGNHLAVTVAKPPDAWQEIKPNFWRDEFGVVWNRTVDKDIGIVDRYLLSKPSLKDYEFPDPYSSGRFDHFGEFIEKNKDKFRVVEIGFSLFERAWTLRGMENLFVDMIEHPSFVDDFLDRIVEYNLGIVEQAVKYDIDAMYFGDDWGQQRGMLMGPILWKKYFKPRLAKTYAKVKEAGKVVLIHSCGDVEEIFPDLIEIGVDIFNPFQPEVMDVFEMKRRYGDRLTFYGGISIQKTLPYGTVDDVKRTARKMMKEIGKEGGYILSPAHAVPKDVPLENLLALIETVQNQ